ncbi:SMI1/KNR4 family protein [Amycolatopsis sp. TRM77291]
MSIDASERLIELVRANGDVSNRADGANEGTIAAAERTLGVEFPRSYRRLVEEFGTWDIAGLEFLGVYSAPGVRCGGFAATASISRTGWNR